MRGSSPADAPQISQTAPHPPLSPEYRGEGKEAPVLIIGYGNPLRGDDALGHVAAQKLCELFHNDRVEIITSHQLTPEMSEPISRAALVIFIDASASDPPGHVSRVDLAPPDHANLRDSHELGPPALLGLARALFGKAARGILFSVGASDFDLREGLSKPAQRGTDDAVRQATQVIRDFLASHKPL